jgi:predicted DNA-binding transcriptional regulator YafY
MYSPTTRLLTILELLQSKASVSGPELAKKLEVDVRSVRRYVTMLRDMGVPVESESGRYGIYYLRSSFRLPPLMFTNDEILVIMLGLMTAQTMGLSQTLALESATAKIERVLPDELKQQAQALQEALTLNMPTAQSSADNLIAQISLAVYRKVQISMVYHSTERTERVVDAYGLVYNNGFWYITGYCHLRQDVRIFRLDRIEQLKVMDTTFEAPKEFDALSFLQTKIAGIPYEWAVEVLLKTNITQTYSRVSPAMGTLEQLEEGVLLQMNVKDLEWVARFIVSLECDFIVIHPPELRDELRKLAQSLLRIADT